MLMFVILSTSVGLVAIGSGTGLIPLPYEMFVLAERMVFVFKAHMVTGAIVLMLAPAVIAVRHHARLHRMLGRVMGGFVVIAGLTSFPVATMSDSSIAARAGFFVQGLVWLYLLVRGVIAIRAGDRARHARFMLAMVAVTSGAVWFRVIVGSAILLRLPFEPVYAAASWLGWILPLIVVLAWPQLTRGLLVRRPFTGPSPLTV
ncbi:MAG: DUF2306 domain-containing protein [Hyphomicrobium sp.]